MHLSCSLCDLPRKAISEGTKAPCSSGRQFETLAGSFQRRYSKLCELVQAMSAEPIIKQILRFEPPIPQSCMVHIYLKGVPGLTIYMTFFLLVSILCFATIVYTYVCCICLECCTLEVQIQFADLTRGRARSCCRTWRTDGISWPEIVEPFTWHSCNHETTQMNLGNWNFCLAWCLETWVM